MTDTTFQIGGSESTAATAAGSTTTTTTPDVPTRGVLEIAALASAVAGLLSAVPGLRVALLVLFVLTGPGLATVVWTRLTGPARVAAVPLVGLSLMTGLTATLAWVDVWAPAQLLLVLVTAVIASAVLSLRNHRLDVDWERLASAVTSATRRVNGPLLTAVVVLGAWLVALPGMSDAESERGLLFSGTGAILVPLACALVIAFVVAVRSDRLITAGAVLAATIVVVRGTVTAITDLPIYPWTYKHVGIVDYLMVHHALPPTGIDIYREWPAAFTSFAWLSSVSTADPLTIAHWFAPVTHVILAVLVGMLARALGLSRMQALSAAFVMELANWVGQDYYSPQALAFVMGVSVVSLLVSARGSVAANLLAFVGFAATVPTHQLTPFWLFGLLVLLTVTRRMRPAWLVLPYAVVLFGYLYPRRGIVFAHGIFSGANPVANGATNADYVGSADKVFTSLACRGVSAAIVVLAAIAVVFWWRTKRPFAIPAMIAFSPFVLLFVNDYGGEAIFRTFLYAVPGCAILIAPLLAWLIRMPARTPALRGLGPVAAALVLAGIAVGALQGYYGMWAFNLVTPAQLALVEELPHEANGPVTVWNLQPSGFPTRPTADFVALAGHDDAFDTPIADRWPGFLDGFPDRGQFEDVTEAARTSPGQTFFVFTEGARRAYQYLGYASADAVSRFEDQFRTSPRWTPWRTEADTTIFRYVPEPPLPQVDPTPAPADVAPADPSVDQTPAPSDDATPAPSVDETPAPTDDQTPASPAESGEPR
jgi:hypothetical protein